MTFLRQYLKQYAWWLVVGLALSLGSVALTLYIPVLVGKTIDTLVLGGVNFESVRRYLALIGGLAAVDAGCQWGAKACYNRATFGIAYRMRMDAMAKIQRLPLSYLDAHSTGETLSRVVADVETIADGLLMGFSQLFSGVATIMGTLAFMFSIHWLVALVVVSVTPLSLFVSRFIAKHTHARFEKQAQIRAQQTALCEEMISNQKTVQAFLAEERVQQRFDVVNDALAVETQIALFYSSLTNPCTRFVNAVVYAAVACVGALAVAQILPLGTVLTVGSLSVLLSYANQYTKPFNEISGVITELQNALVCLQRVGELCSLEEEEDAGVSALPVKVGQVDMQNVAFSYDKTRPLLQDITLHAAAGQRIAIVGPTGCGKTTLINLLMRFYEVDGGCISVDGVDITSVPRHTLRRQFGMVLQDTWIRHASVLENLRIAKPDATLQEVQAVAVATHAHSFIERLPQGYDTVISDGGSLSQGQKQLLCVTRAMLAAPNILILDEATSNIDIRTEQVVNRAFDVLMQGKTSFVVAHRLSTVQSADCIVVMVAGRIAEMGTHRQLLQQQGVYYDLYQSGQANE